MLTWSSPLHSPWPCLHAAACSETLSQPTNPPIMKNLALLLSLAAISLGFSSCCSMFGILRSPPATARKPVRSKPAAMTSSPSKSSLPAIPRAARAAWCKPSKRRFPATRQSPRKVRIPCGNCTRYYCPKKDCCGTTSESTMRMASAQGSVGSPQHRPDPDHEAALAP